ncbi:MAG TPA: winged helix-turn-helix domain-containing protein [Xanthobacteraceae bacterium]|jgi:DNA-binding transcriptional ArsR family regulator|nr:winged helix-turn-helix domain-containing protein [Xanthobacteraceae bacterium]
MVPGPHIAEVAHLVGDPARANILAALMDARALTASELAYAAGVSPQTTSSHLGKLAEARLLAVETQGRHRYYRLASPLVAHMLESVMAVAACGPPRHRPASRLDDELRAARSCYDHLAGRLGVALADALVGRGFVALDQDGGEVTPAGFGFFAELGIDLEPPGASRRVFCRPCLDWTERRHHLAGHVGACLMRHCFDRHWLQRKRDSRAVTVTPAGARHLAEIFGISLI